MPWLVFQMLSFKPTFSLSSFTFIKRLFSSSSLSSIKMVSSAYLRLLIFLLAILIPACASSSLAFLMMYSAYELNKQGDNIQPWRTPFSIWAQSLVPWPVLTVAFWPAYRSLLSNKKGMDNWCKEQLRWWIKALCWLKKTTLLHIFCLHFFLFFSFLLIISFVYRTSLS